MKFGVVVFPGTWSDRDCGHVVEDVLGADLVYLWHKDRDLHGADCVILPGGFRYGDEGGHVTAGANPNGSERGIAGIVNDGGNVLGMMPHPERCAEADLGGTDGLLLFRSIVQAAVTLA